jgi:hypothetical protein
VPFLAAQDTFKAQAEAKYLADELEAKLAPAEVRHGETWSDMVRPGASGDTDTQPVGFDGLICKILYIKYLYKHVQKM